MRALFLLHGAPGTGKSSLISQLGVESLAIGYDRFHALFSVPFPCVDADAELSETLRMAPETEKAAVSAAHKALETRLAAGSTVFFDATNSREADQTKLAKIGRAYGYRTYLIDCQGESSVETLLERNRHRGTRRVDEKVVRDMHARCAKKPVSAMITKVIDGTKGAALVWATISEIAAVPSIATDESTRRIVVVGDVHSCAEALDEAVEKLDAEATRWVFAGDLFDRGPDPVGVWRTVTRLIDEGRATVVTGNHELNLRAINTHTATAPFVDTRTTRDQLLAAGIFAGKQTAFVNTTVPMLHLHVGGKLWTVTHGGVSTLTCDKISIDGLLRISDAECVYGLGDRGHTYRAKTSYDVAAMPLAGRQLHGHRNGRVGEEPVETIRKDRHGDPIVCLESDVSAGGELSVAVLDQDGSLTVHRFDDRVDAELAAQNQALPWNRKKPAESRRARCRPQGSSGPA